MITMMTLEEKSGNLSKVILSSRSRPVVNIGTGRWHQLARSSPPPSLRSVQAMKFTSKFLIVPPMLWNFSNSRKLQRFFVAHTGAVYLHLFRTRSRLLLKWGQMESLKRWGSAEDHMPAPPEDEGHCLNGHTPRAAVPGLKGMEDDTLTFLHLCAPSAAPRNCTISQSMPLCHTPVESGAMGSLRNNAVVPRKRTTKNPHIDLGSWERILKKIKVWWLF